jgi:hypothetical protein
MDNNITTASHIAAVLEKSSVVAVMNFEKDLNLIVGRGRIGAMLGGPNI